MDKIKMLYGLDSDQKTKIGFIWSKWNVKQTDQLKSCDIV